jgi:hypothetical protein
MVPGSVFSKNMLPIILMPKVETYNTLADMELLISLPVCIMAEESTCNRQQQSYHTHAMKDSSL